MELDLPGLNIEQGLDVFDGEEEDYLTALNSFIKNTPEIIDKLRSVTKENLPNYAINVHGLKSISGWICAESIRAGAEELEHLAKAGDLSGVTARNVGFLDRVDAFIKDLKAALEKISPE
jgi:HPt (histidine-containing phosphotransfer) domain-containing protein